jgi:hypothetical protein
MHAVEVVRRPVGPPEPGEAEVDLEVDLGRPVHVIAHVEIQQAVVVGIEEGGRGRPVAFQPPHAGLVGHLPEVSSLVAEQPVAADRGDEDVDPAVVVVVADGDAHAVQLDVQSRLFGDVGEAAGPVVPVQGEGRALRTLVSGPVTGVDQQDVLVPTVVGIEYRDAGTDGFGQQALAEGAVDMGEVDAGLGGDVGEAQGRRPLGAGARERLGRQHRDLVDRYGCVAG